MDDEKVSEIKAALEHLRSNLSEVVDKLDETDVEHLRVSLTETLKGIDDMLADPALGGAAS